MVRKMKKFLRRVWHKHSKLGKGRKKLQKWKKPTGRDNKLREKKKGYGPVVSIGYKNNEKDRLETILICNISDLNKVGKDQVGTLGRIGLKKKIEVLKKAQEKKIKMGNVNIEKFLKENVKEKKK
jgi:large subunit ribosomal protein L32e